MKKTRNINKAVAGYDASRAAARREPHAERGCRRLFEPAGRVLAAPPEAGGKGEAAL